MSLMISARYDYLSEELCPPVTEPHQLLHQPAPISQHPEETENFSNGLCEKVKRV